MPPMATVSCRDLDPVALGRWQAFGVDPCDEQSAVAVVKPLLESQPSPVRREVELREIVRGMSEFDDALSSCDVVQMVGAQAWETVPGRTTADRRWATTTTASQTLPWQHSGAGATN